MKDYFIFDGEEGEGASIKKNCKASAEETNNSPVQQSKEISCKMVKKKVHVQNLAWKKMS